MNTAEHRAPNGHASHRSLWLARFASKLSRLQPGLSGGAYEQIAEWNYTDAADLPPEQAAALYVVDRPVRKVSPQGKVWTWPSGA